MSTNLTISMDQESLGLESPQPTNLTRGELSPIHRQPINERDRTSVSQMVPLSLISVKGKGGHARTRINARNRAIMWFNRASVALRQLHASFLDFRELGLTKSIPRGLSGVPLKADAKWPSWDALRQASICDMERFLLDRPVDVVAGPAALGWLRVPSGYGGGGIARGTVVRTVTEWVDLPSRSPISAHHFSDRVATLVTGFTETMLRSPPPQRDEWEAIKSFMDPALRVKNTRMKLVKRLWDGGLLRWIEKPALPCVVDFFTVLKDIRIVDGKETQRQRLVFDMRRINLFFREPIQIELASIEAFACVGLGPMPDRAGWTPGLVLDGWGKDVQDWFYRIRLPDEMTQFFVIQDSPADLAREIGVPVSDLFPEAEGREGALGMCVCVMGWSWAPLIAQWCIEDAVTSPEMLPELRLAHQSIAPRFFGDAAGHGCESGMLHFAYIDDFGGLGLVTVAERDSGVSTVRKAGDAVADRLRALGLVVHKEQAGLPLEALGVVFVEEPALDGSGNVEYSLVPKPKKAWILYECAMELVVSGRASPRILSGVISGFTWIFLLNRPFLSIFSACYKLISDNLSRPTVPVMLWDSVRSELAVAASLVGMLRARLSAPWSTMVQCVDAGPELGALIYVSAELAEVRACGAVGERSGWSVYGVDEPHVPRPPPAVEVEWGPRRAWRLGPVMTWRESEHNNVGEMRIAVCAIERAARSPACRGCRILLLSDSMVSIGALAKGRSSSRPILRLCRRALAVVVAARLRVACRYVPTWLNAADGPSRGIRRPCVHSETIAKAVEKHRARKWTMPPSLIIMAASIGISVADLTPPLATPAKAHACEKHAPRCATADPTSGTASPAKDSPGFETVASPRSCGTR